MMTLTPPLKWAGGKRWLIPHLTPIWQPYSHMRLVEPFCGGLGVALSLNPKRALLNDINPHLINLYHWMQRGFDAVDLSPEDNNEATFYAKREQFNTAIKQNRAKTPNRQSYFITSIGRVITAYADLIARAYSMCHLGHINTFPI